MTKKSIFLLVFIIAINSFSQEKNQQNKQNSERPAIATISGKVIDKANNEPVEFATISVISKKENKTVNGCITSKNGVFEITKVKFGMYKIVVSFIGYSDITIDNIKLTPDKTNINLGKIELENSAQTLKNIDVVAEKNVYVSKIDKKVYNVDKNIASESSSLLETMQNIPSVNVDQDGNVSLRGNPNVKVLIDGRPSSIMGTDLPTILQQFPANSVEEIEIITNPSAKYDPDGMAGIINIKLKKQSIKGTNGSVMLAGATNSEYNGSVTLNHQQGKFNVFGTYSYRHGNREFSKFSTRKNILTDTTYYLKDFKIGNKLSNSQMINGGLDFYISEKSTISYTGGYSFSNGNGTENMEYDYITQDAIINSITTRNSIETSKRGSLDNSLLFSQKFGNPGQELTANFTYATSFHNDYGTYSQNLYDGNYSLVSDTTYKQYDQSEDKHQNYILQTDYTHPFGKNSKLETGFKSEMQNMYNEYMLQNFDYQTNNFITDSTSINNFNYIQKIHGVYGILSGNISKLSLQGGLRYEYAETNFDIAKTTENYKNTYQSFFPSLHLSYAINDLSEYQLSYSRRINRPSVHSLNPFTDASDPENIRIGNPYLQPEYINSFDLGYSKRFEKISIISSIYYKMINGVIKRYKQVNADGNSIMTFINLDSGTDYGVELVLDLKYIKWLRINASGNFYRTIIEGSSTNNDLSNDAYGISTKIMLDGKLPSKISAQLSAAYNTPETIPQGTKESMFWADFSIKKVILNDKGSISLSLSDIFNTRKYHIMLSDYNFEQDVQFKHVSRILKISFNYKFGKTLNNQKPKKEKRPNNGGNEDIEM